MPRVDSAAAWAIFEKDNIEGKPVTVEMKINYLKTVCSGKLAEPEVFVKIPEYS